MMFPDEPAEYTAINSVKKHEGGDVDDPALTNHEFLATLNPNDIPPHALRVAENVTIMLLRNLKVDQGFI